MGIFEKIFGTHSENELKHIYPIVDHIEALEPEMQKLSDAELKAKTREFRERLGKRNLSTILRHLSSRCTRNWQKSNRSCTTWVPYMQR